MKEDLGGDDFDGGPLKIGDLEDPFLGGGLEFEDASRGVQCRTSIIRRRKMVQQKGKAEMSDDSQDDFLEFEDIKLNHPWRHLRMGVGL